MSSEYEIITSQMPGKHHAYLGDAVYVSFDGYQVWLSTTNGIGITNSIALEPPVYMHLLDYVENLKKSGVLT